MRACVCCVAADGCEQKVCLSPGCEKRITVPNGSKGTFCSQCKDARNKLAAKQRELQRTEAQAVCDAHKSALGGAADASSSSSGLLLNDSDATRSALSHIMVQQNRTSDLTGQGLSSTHSSSSPRTPASSALHCAQPNDH
jgi:hypothetical protein